MQQSLVSRLKMGQVLYSGDPFSTLTTQHTKMKHIRKTHRFAMHIILKSSSPIELNYKYFFF